MTALHATLAIVAVTACALLPFAPGRYDALAVPLSATTMPLGTIGLVVVPLAGLWIAADRSRRLAPRRRMLARIAIVAATPIAGVVGLVAAIEGGMALGIVLVALWLGAALPAWRRLPRGGDPGARRAALPVYLATAPVVAALLQLAVVERATEFSRRRSIANCAPLIAAIERYHATHGRYPPSLAAVHQDILPDVVGIREYRYEPHRQAYNVVFEQFTARVGTREFVVYNPRDEQVVTSHALDLLELSPAALDRQRGFYAVHGTAYPHWKIFWFD